MLDSVARSSYSRLDNGNTLIVESMAGRAIEVTAKGDTVWEFINPVRDIKAQDKIPIIFWMQRLDSKRDLAPAFRNEISLD
jgi:hypothetical protein